MRNWKKKLFWIVKFT